MRPPKASNTPNPTPQRTFGFLLKDASKLYVQRFEQRARELGLTLPQCKALVYLARSEGISQVELAGAAEIEPMTLVRILDRMELDGWLERRANPTDRRARRLYLKRKCKPLLETIDKISSATRDEAFAGFSSQEAQSLLAGLERVRGNLASLQSIPQHARPKTTQARIGK
ncbi:MAG TPA: MarR family transcriptional regulator [Steroidobacteraceae bacterium]|jgi:DNA-binding MarR family transcriptional regulator|nr:MarR family transcriptional regulator [Steroidobacteraceae bacterium]